MQANGKLRSAAHAVTAGTTPWYAANNGAGKRIWFVCRGRDGCGGVHDYHRSKKGDIVRYSFEGAVRKALALNGKAS